MTRKKQIQKTQYELVKEFHETYNHPVKEAPELPSPDRLKLRLNLILEEANELIRAVAGENENHKYLMAAAMRVSNAKDLVSQAPDYEFQEGDLLEIAKELTDGSYVQQGMGLECGINLDSTMIEVHDSNMSKLGEDGKPIYNEMNKVIKGPNYRLPDMEKVLFGKSGKAA